MIRRQYKDVKNELARVAGAAGQSMSSSQIMAYLNMATEEFMNEFDPPSVIDRLRFQVTKSRFSLPSEYDRVMMMTVDTVPAQMQSPWFEFVGYGLDLLCEVPADNMLNYYWNQGIIDQDQVGVFTDVPTDLGVYTLRVYGQVNEKVCGERPNITIFGYDQYGHWIRSATGNSSICATGNGDEPPNFVDGIQVPINGDTDPFYVQTTQGISEITAISKPETRGQVFVYAMPAAGAGVHIGTYAPKDTTPVYRRYWIPNLQRDRVYTILARCRRRFVPITADTDFLLISNLPALKAMIMSVYYLEAAEPEQYAKYKAIAVDILKKEAKAYIGLQRQKPPITFSEGALRQDGMYIV